jgi:rod shape-determining protein MreC
VLVLLSVTFVTLSDRSGNGGVFAKARSYARDVANPFQSAVHSVLEPVGNFLYGATHYGEVEKQVEALRREVAAGQAAAVQAAATEQEAQQVLAQQHLDFVGSIPTVAAQVVDLGSANFEQSVEINRGTANGVAIGEPVVTAGGLVGKVTAVSARLATVTLIDDPSSVVGVRVVRSGVLGAAAGEGEGNSLRLDDVNAGSKIRAGDHLVTSGLELEHYPAGLPVGTVTSVYAPAGALQLDVSLKPFANLVDLELVRVLLWSPQTG